LISSASPIATASPTVLKPIIHERIRLPGVLLGRLHPSSRQPESGCSANSGLGWEGNHPLTWCVLRVTSPATLASGTRPPSSREPRA
jgi:hypothetical protein